MHPVRPGLSVPLVAAAHAVCGARAAARPSAGRDPAACGPPQQQIRSEHCSVAGTAVSCKPSGSQGRPKGGVACAAAADREPTQQAAAADGSLGVVITGATKGFGFALAQELVAGGDWVVICGRDERRLAAAAAALRRRAGRGAQVHALRCDVSNGHDVAALGDFAAAQLGTVHLWVNNAGAVTGKSLLADMPQEEITQAVGTNVLGSLLCCREAIRVMRAQPQAACPKYHIFNLGFSAWGRKLSATACTHKATKSALSALTEALAEDLTAAGVTSVGVHNLSPGMVLTDLLLKDSSAGARRFFNALAEEPETVAAALAPQLRTIQGSGGSVDYLSPAGSVARVVSRVPQIVRGGRFFDGKGERVAEPGQSYAKNGVRQLFES